MDSVIREPENSASIFINTESGEVLHDADAACPTRVMRAVQAGKVDVVMEWIVAGGHPNAVAFSGDSMVHFAAEANQLFRDPHMWNSLMDTGDPAARRTAQKEQKGKHIHLIHLTHLIY